MRDELEDLDLLLKAAQEAGSIALRFFQQAHIPNWMKRGESPVSEADLAVDACLKNYLLGARPHYGWISEESTYKAPALAQNAARFFVIDPIDGTRGFLNKSPQWCLSLAVVQNHRPVAGVIFCPVLEKMYSAIRQEGAYLNGQALLPFKASALESKKVEEEGAQQRPLFVSGSAAIVKNWTKSYGEIFKIVRPIPSLAYRLALLAEKKIDIVLVRPNAYDWDLAAADLLLSEVGGLLADGSNRAPYYAMYPFHHAALLGVQDHSWQKRLNLAV